MLRGDFIRAGDILADHIHCHVTPDPGSSPRQCLGVIDVLKGKSGGVPVTGVQEVAFSASETPGACGVSRVQRVSFPPSSVQLSEAEARTAVAAIEFIYRCEMSLIHPDRTHLPPCHILQGCYGGKDGG